jgi:ribonuclease HI
LETRPTEANFEVNASIGVATNNGGELFAIGLGVEIAEHSDYSGPIHIYTDSMIVKDALTKNTSAGSTNSALLQRVKQTLHLYRQRKAGNSVHFNWVDAHCGIDQNELADAQAGIGSRNAIDQPHSDSLYRRFAHSKASFLSLTRCTAYPTLTDILAIYDG